MTDDVDKVIACLMPAQVLVDKLCRDDCFDEAGYQYKIVQVALDLFQTVQKEVWAIPPKPAQDTA